MLPPAQDFEQKHSESLLQNNPKYETNSFSPQHQSYKTDRTTTTGCSDKNMKLPEKTLTPAPWKEIV